MNKILFIAAFILMFSGCGKSSLKNANSLIVGKWNYSYQRDLYLNPKGLVIAAQTTTTWPNQDFVVFNLDATGGYYNNTSSNPVPLFTYTISGNRETELQGNTPPTVNITIVSLTSTQLQRHSSITASDGSMHLVDETLIR